MGASVETLRPWWANCPSVPDLETRALDAMEDELAPLDQACMRIRRLIGSLELCHHKAERHVQLILEGIGAGDTSKGSFPRTFELRHPQEELWESCCAVLDAWCRLSERRPNAPAQAELPSELVERLGPPTALKVWQVERVVEKIRSVLAPGDVWREDTDSDDADIRAFRAATRATVIDDTIDGRLATLPLSAAIDHLEPCHWDFPNNLWTVLGAIGGQLQAQRPFGACGRNIRLVPWRDRMAELSCGLRMWCGLRSAAQEPDARLEQILGARNATKRWLALSLDKTLRQQLHL